MKITSRYQNTKEMKAILFSTRGMAGLVELRNVSLFIENSDKLARGLQCFVSGKRVVGLKIKAAWTVLNSVKSGR